MTSKDDRRLIRFSWESLELPCEWEKCEVVENMMHSYLTHIDTCHLSYLSETDLHCHWRDCEAFAETLTELRRHILFHAFHTKIKCFGRNLQQRKKLSNCFLDSHSRNIIPELPDPLICCWEECDDAFENPEAFYRHVDSHAEWNSKNCKQKSDAKCCWQGCNRTFTDPYKVKDHVRCHTQEKLMACPTCGGMFSSRTKFLDHIQRQAPLTDVNDGVYMCDYCSRKMPTERLLRDHMRHHVNHYKCPYCDMTCPSPSGMQNHIHYRHSEIKPYSCQYCDYKGKSKNDLRKHLETHSSVPTYICPVEGCNYTTRSQTCYNSHLRKRHEGEKASRYACHLCNKIFSRGNYLTKHLRERHKFRWPSGHCRFRYHQDEDGLFRLQTVRYESIELSEAMLQGNNESIDSPNTHIENSSFNPEHCVQDASEHILTANGTKTPFQELALSTNLESASDESQATVVCIPVIMYVQDSEQDTGNRCEDTSNGQNI